jgi:hypothetical protein
MKESKIIKGNNFLLDLLEFEKLTREVGFANCEANNKDGNELYDKEAIETYKELREKQLIMLEELIKFYSPKKDI